MSRLKERYQKDVMPALKKEFGYKNVMAIPKVEKVVINMGLGEATQNAKLADVGADELGRITGQKAVVRRATKSIAQFKLRQGMPVGAMVTLRGERMYEFLDRLVNVALPRVRDFRGVSPKGFDGRGNYTLGLKDQLLFPEIDYMKVDKARGMNISVVTTGKDSGKRGRVLKVIPDKNRVIVEGVNIIKRHTRPNPQRNIKGGIVTREASLHASNVQLVCPECGKMTRIGHKILADGRKVRICRKCEGVVDK